MNRISELAPPVDPSKSPEDWLPDIAQVVGLGIWKYIPDTGEIHCSSRAKEIFGLSPTEDWNYAQLLRSVHVLDRQRVVGALEQSLDPLVRAPYDIEYRIL